MRWIGSPRRSWRVIWRRNKRIRSVLAYVVAELTISVETLVIEELIEGRVERKIVIGLSVREDVSGSVGGEVVLHDDQASGASVRIRDLAGRDHGLGQARVSGIVGGPGPDVAGIDCNVDTELVARQSDCLTKRRQRQFDVLAGIEANNVGQATT